MPDRTARHRIRQAEAFGARVVAAKDATLTKPTETEKREQHD